MLQARSTILVDHCKAAMAGDFRHPASVMNMLGIDYEYAQDDPRVDVRIFHGCTNVPRGLPSYVRAIG